MSRAIIISPHFCTPHPVDLRIVKEFNSGNFSVKLADGNTVFHVLEGPFLSLRRVLTDATRYPIVTLQKKLMSLHQTWEVYRGDSNNPRNLMFRVKKSSVVQLCKTTLHVFLASNNGDSAPDFKVKGNWLQDSCVIYAGKSKSSNIVAQMKKKKTVTSMLFGKDSYRVTVYPGVDQAFVVVLIFILHETNYSGGSDSGGGGND